MADGPKSSAASPTRLDGPSKSWEHRDLYDRVVKALYALPWEFDTDINIVGIRVTDLYTFNSALGAAIEQSVVENLNKLRPVWDPDDEYRLYRFVRQAQVFPDVRLQSGAPGGKHDIIMGIELKGWFAMAKEGEPSFRYTVSPKVCAPQDLLVVYPWILKEVISGAPMLLQPFVEEARFAAETRNHYWRVERGRTGSAAQVIEPTTSKIYPAKGEKLQRSSGQRRRKKLRSCVTRRWHYGRLYCQLNERAGVGCTARCVATVCFDLFRRPDDRGHGG